MPPEKDFAEANDGVTKSSWRSAKIPDPQTFGGFVTCCKIYQFCVPVSMVKFLLLLFSLRLCVEFFLLWFIGCAIEQVGGSVSDYDLFFVPT